MLDGRDGQRFFLLLCATILKGFVCKDDSQCGLGPSSHSKALLQSKSRRQPQVALSSLELRPAYPKVLRSKSDNSTLFYHVHLPKTGGSTVAHLLASDICAPYEDLLDIQGWRSMCGVTCDLGFTDNEFACADPNRQKVEHWTFDFNQERAEKLKTNSGASKIVYVTTLRRGSDRVVSQWKAELGYRSFIPPKGVAPFSMQSLQHYIQARSFDSKTVRTFDGKHYVGKGWLTRNPSLRSNFQVGMLASRMGAPDLRVRAQDLEKAKKVLSTGSWIIGFMPCMQELQDKLLEFTARVHGGYKKKRAPEDNKAKESIAIDKETQDMLDGHSYLDNALFDWAWSLAKNQTDPRFTRIC